MSQNSILKLIRIVLFVLVCLWLVLLNYFSGQTGIESGKLSENIAEKILIIKDKITKKIYTIKNKINNIQTSESYGIIENTENSNKVSEERILRWNKVLRKVAHFGIFTLGGFLLYMFYVSLKNEINFSFGKFILSSTTGIIVACFDEFHQKFSYGRSPEVKDVFIDSCGCLTGVVIAIICVWILVKIIDFILKYKEIRLLENVKN